MISNDFEKGGFPVNKRCPVLCTDKTGAVYVAYNNFKIKQIFEQVDVVKCLGIWPGKVNTDVYRLSLEHYGKFAPPEEHKDIDSGTEIVIIMDGIESQVSYVPVGSSVPLVTKSKELYEYIINVGLKNKVVKV